MNHQLNRRAAWITAAVLGLTGAAVASAPAWAKEKSKASKSTSEKTSKEKSESGYLGVYMQDLSEDVRKGLDLDVKHGVLVSGISEDSPAAKAGIEEGDVITSFGGKDVDSPGDLRDAVSAFQPGAEAKVEFVRDGKEQSAVVTVGERPEGETFSWSSPDVDVHMPNMSGFHRAFTFVGGPRLGIQAHELEEDDNLSSYFGTKEGILVLEVEEESVAAKAGVQAGDVIKSIGDEKVEDVGDLRDAVNDFDEGDEFTITVLRHGKTQSLKATMDEQEFSFNDSSAPAFREFRHMRAPRVRVDQQELRQELDQLKKEIQEMKEELKRQDS
jgi:S1-C subfamily serine protease